jgi:hypothetical protein
VIDYLIRVVLIQREVLVQELKKKKYSRTMIERSLAPDFMKIDRSRINQICEIAKKMHVSHMPKKSVSIILNHCVGMIDQSRYGGMQSMNGIRTFTSQ